MKEVVMKFSPLLAANADVTCLGFPLLVSPKIDGIRALVKDGVVYARSGKPIPNRHVQKLFGRFHGYDGELLVGDPADPKAFRNSQGGVMSKDGEPDVAFWLFDAWNRGDMPYSRWLDANLAAQRADALGERVVLVPQTLLHRRRELNAYESKCLKRGFEGVMLRDPQAGYKNGRSTVKEGILLKLKRFADAEAVVIGLEEQRDKGGNPNGTLGALRVRDLVSGVCFKIGSGFEGDERAKFWRMGEAMYGAYVRYRHFPSGAAEKPRFPVFDGLRGALDLVTV